MSEHEHDRAGQQEHPVVGNAAGTAMAPDASHPDDGGHDDPPYFLIWGVLFVLTMAEVGYAFLDLPKFWLASGLIVMAVWKAVLVALYYMHLRFEPPKLWLLAVSPLPLALILVLAVLTEF